MRSNHLAQLGLRTREAWLRCYADDRGQGLIEYALILILVAMVVLTILLVISKQVNNLYSNIQSGINT